MGWDGKGWDGMVVGLVGLWEGGVVVGGEFSYGDAGEAGHSVVKNKKSVTAGLNGCSYAFLAL